MIIIFNNNLNEYPLWVNKISVKKKKCNKWMLDREKYLIKDFLNKSMINGIYFSLI